jgi:hypothetical protein
MSSPQKASPRAALSLDVWAIILTFLLALLVRAGVIKSIPW